MIELIRDDAWSKSVKSFSSYRDYNIDQLDAD
jgi:hypothetical protein